MNSTLTVYVNGDEVASFGFDAEWSVYPQNLIVVSGSVSDVSVYTAEEGEDIYGLAKDASVDGHVVPEPTALALLALGVAGVALRHRAA